MNITDVRVLKLIYLIKTEGMYCNHPLLDNNRENYCGYCSSELLRTCEDDNNYITFEQAKKELGEEDLSLLMEILL